MKNILMGLCLIMMSCSHKTYKTVDFVDRDKFMGTWYVQAGRFTLLEKDVHNGVETYQWNQEKERIDIDFRFNKGSLDGKVTSLPQKGWIQNTKTNAHWKVSPMWPLKFDYLVIAVGKSYEWTAIGVPNKNYLWIMTRDRNVTKERIESLIKEVQVTGYPTENLVFVPHSSSP